MFFTVIISLVCMYLGYMMACRHFLPRVNQLVPTFPGRLPIIGHSYMWLNNETLIQSLTEIGDYALKVGGVAKLYMGPMPLYVVTDPVDVATVLNKCLKKMFVYRFIEPMVGNTLIAAEEDIASFQSYTTSKLKLNKTVPQNSSSLCFGRGNSGKSFPAVNLLYNIIKAAEAPIWKRNRRIIDPCFKQHVLDEFLKLFTDRAERFVALLAEDAGKGEVDLTEKITRSVVETACQTTLGIKVDGRDLVDNNYLIAIKDLLDVPVTRINKPWLMLDFIFNLSSCKRKLTRAIETASKLTQQMLVLRKSEHLQRLKTKGDYEGGKLTDGKFQSILDVLIENTVTETSSVFTDVVLRNLIDNVLVGGFDTTICEMLFTFACIGSYPDVQEKIYQEIIQVLGEEGRVSKQNIPQLVYLEAAIKESLRLYPAVVGVGREATVDTKLRNMTIPAGSSVLVHIRSVNRNTEYWGADAEEFKPERWLSPDTAPSHRAAFGSFSPGLRGCIGKTYAVMYMKATMAQVLRKLKLTADHTKIKLECHIMMKPVSGHLVRIEER